MIDIKFLSGNGSVVFHQKMGFGRKNLDLVVLYIIWQII